MKLRNKKTEEIIEDKCLNYALDDMKQYYSLAELNAEWEDYVPTEPLIKDERIRKVVRAWAEANIANEVSYDEGEDCIYVPYASDNTDTSNVCITFDNYNVFKGLEHRKLYTITELCGEEEE